MILSLYDQLCNSLGKSESDSIFADFVQDIGPLVVEMDYNDMKFWQFSCGVGLMFKQELCDYRECCQIFFYAQPENIQILPYSHDLAKGIKITDDRNIVQQKLDQQPEELFGLFIDDTKRKTNSEVYITGKFEITFRFDKSSDVIESVEVVRPDQLEGIRVYVE